MVRGWDVEVPSGLFASHRRFFREGTRAWLNGLPALAGEWMERWGLRLDGRPCAGAVALVLPVVREDGTPAVLKLQPVDAETRGEPDALAAWRGRGAVRLLAAEPRTGVLLLERLDAGRSLGGVEDEAAALRTLAEILAGLVAVPAPAGVRSLGEVAADLVERAEAIRGRGTDRRLVADCVGRVREVLGEPGDRLLHWDLHYDNVLATLPGSGRGPWLAIDPKPLMGDPGFDLFPALWNRWEEVERSGNVARSVRRRFDLMTEVLGLDRRRATAWTCARALQNVVWSVEQGDPVPAVPAAVARALLRAYP